MAIVKDCLYGQVRAVTETHLGHSNTWIPPELNVGKQEAVTWTNVTGMNPLWDHVSMPTVYTCYGEMLREAALNKSIYTGSFIPSTPAPEEFYIGKIRENYKNAYSMMCMALAPFWCLDVILKQDDIEEYDYIAVRQFDTWWADTSLSIDDLLDTSPGSFTSQVFPYDPLYARKKAPLAYVIDQGQYPDYFPIVGNIASCFFILNRYAVNILKQDFFKIALHEIDLLHEQLGPSQFLIGNPGSILFKVFMKNNIHAIDIAPFEVCKIKDGWSVSSENYAHLERMTGESS